MHDAPAISPDNKDSSADDFRALPKVALRAEVTAHASGDVTQAVRQRAQELARDNVAYAELHVSPRAFDPAADIEAVVDAALAGVREVDGIDARLVLVVAAEDTADTAADIVRVAIARATADRRDVVGVRVAERDVAGGDFAAVQEVIDKARAAFVPVTLDAGRTGSTDSIEAAVRAGADRIGLAENMIDDFTADIDGIQPGVVSAWVRDRHIALETAPLDAEGEIADHPLPLLQQLGFTCTVGLGGDGDLTEVFAALHDALGYGLEEFFDLTIKAVENSFHTEPERQHLIETVILPAYEELSDAEFAEDAELADADSVDAESDSGAEA